MFEHHKVKPSAPPSPASGDALQTFSQSIAIIKMMEIMLKRICLRFLHRYLAALYQRRHVVLLGRDRRPPVLSVRRMTLV